MDEELTPWWKEGNELPRHQRTLENFNQSFARRHWFDLLVVTLFALVMFVFFVG